MDIQTRQSGCKIIYTLIGRFDAYQVPRIKAHLEPVMSDLELDFSDVNFIDSTGLALLVSLYKKVRLSEFRLTIKNVGDEVRLIFEITKLDSILPIEARE